MPKSLEQACEEAGEMLTTIKEACKKKFHRYDPDFLRIYTELVLRQLDEPAEDPLTQVLETKE